MIEVITGPMFSGKSKELLDIVGILKEKKINYVIFKSSLDSRDYTKLRSRAVKETEEAIVVKSLEDIIAYLKTIDNVSYIIIDEVQFLTGDVRELVKLSKKGMHIIAAGLNLTSELEPFGLMPNLLAVSDNIIKLHTKCAICGRSAKYTAIREEKNEQIMVGDSEYYPICINCLKI